ncbi:MAG: hypothetical protein M3R40_06210 [Pseudomonadota bacterium]|nr:hypothetical protein [Pseudomonadota bacterium]
MHPCSEITRALRHQHDTEAIAPGFETRRIERRCAPQLDLVHVPLRARCLRRRERAFDKHPVEGGGAFGALARTPG